MCRSKAENVGAEHQLRPRRLPPGRHGLPRSFVIDDQRTRILAALADAVSEKGLVAMSVEDVVRRAGVSRRTFYEHFSDKRDAFLAAFDAVTEQAVAAVAQAYASGTDWRERGCRGLLAFLRFIAHDPAFARMGFIEIDAAGQEGQRRRAQSMERFEIFMAPGFELAQTPVPAEIPRAVAGGIWQLIRDCVIRGAFEEIPQRLPVAVYLCVVPFLGPAAAARDADYARGLLSASD